jgi:uncharacterized protein YukE
MTTPLNVNTTQMSEDAEGFSRISQVANQIRSYMENGLGNLGAFWGSDSVGNQFIAEWNPSIQGLQDTLSGVGDGMQATSNGINTSADLYDRANDVNTDLAG